VLIDDYRNPPGEHCGSTAMRNLLRHYCSLELREEVVFGLGAGLDFLYFASDRFSPSVFTFGRSVTLEQDLATALGVDYREQVEPDDGAAWQKVRQEVCEGRPTMLSGDAFYLDYRDFKVHFPAHRFVLVGYDDDAQVAMIADRLDPEPQRCSYRALRLSRNPPEFISTYNLWGKFFGVEICHSLVEAYRAALALNSRRMLEGDPATAEGLRAVTGDPTAEVVTGVAGLAAFLRDLPGWRHRDDRQLLARYASDCIEKFGTGGGNFRTMYAEFLRQARAVVPDLVPEGAPEQALLAATHWTELATHLCDLAEDGGEAASERAVDSLCRILELETRLFESIAEKVSL
jgi:pimeloyl-ACP methyl ester carboxylesterase